MIWKAFLSASRITTTHHMNFKRILIGLAVRELDRMCAIRLVFLGCQKVVLSKNQLRGFDSQATICFVYSKEASH